MKLWVKATHHMVFTFMLYITLFENQGKTNCFPKDYKQEVLLYPKDEQIKKMNEQISVSSMP